MRGENHLVVASAAWAASIPSWLLDEIRDERWILLVRSIGEDLPGHEKIGDAEALAYLMTLGQRTKIPSGLVTVFDDLAREVLIRRSPGMPSVSHRLRRRRLTALEQGELGRLKGAIFGQRGDITHPILNWLQAATRSFEPSGQ